MCPFVAPLASGQTGVSGLAETSSQLFPHTLALADRDLHWGLHYYQQGKWTKALHKFESALAYYLQAQHELGMAKSFNGLSAVYLQWQVYSKVVSYSQSAEVILAPLGTSADAALAAYQQGIAHFHLGDGKAAEQCFERALNLYTELQDTLHENRVLIHLGHLYAAQNKDWLALACCEAVLDRLLTNPHQTGGPQLLEKVLPLISSLSDRPIQPHVLVDEGALA